MELFSANNLNHLKGIKETFAQRTNKSMNNFQSNLKELEIQNLQLEKEKTNLTFKKFEKFVKLFLINSFI